jgi:glutamine amidotransferase
MSESFEFGTHKGLDIIHGSVVPFGKPREGNRRLKIPQMGWNNILRPVRSQDWDRTLLAGVIDNAYMYFVHSFIVKPQEPDITLATTCYGDVEFCSSFQVNNVFACQFHPERSGPQGIQIYRNLAACLDKVE